MTVPVDFDLDSYDFDLPDHLIAQHPLEKRDLSKMLALNAATSSWEHRKFSDIVSLLPDDAALVINNTKVLPARLYGTRPNEMAIEVTLVSQHSLGVWETLIKKAKRIRPGEKLSLADGRIPATAKTRLDNGQWLLEFEDSDTLMERLEQYALMPLPPYIARQKELHAAEDRQRYQTCFASESGAVAAPTAGLHFTPEVLEQIKQRGIPVIKVTLHVGLGTFSPIRCRDIREHTMHHELFSISEESAQQLRQAQQGNRRLIAVGTTSVRVLESLTEFTSQQGSTNHFIYPGYRFRHVSGLLTNFHTPRSSLMLLVSAFCGRKTLLKAYQDAISQNYRFFSYGDCMLLL